MSNVAPYTRAFALEDGGFSTGDSGKTSVTTGSSNAYGTYTSIITTTRNASGFWLFINTNIYAALEGTIRIATDSGGSNIIVNDFPMVSQRSSTEDRAFFFPIRVPAGTTLYIASANVTSSSARIFDCALVMLTADTYGYHKSETLGISSGSATTVTANASANTVGTAVSLGTAGFNWGAMMLVMSAEASAGLTTTEMLVDILIDPAGGTSWTTVCPVSFGKSGGGDAGGPHSLLLPMPVLSGAAIGLQCQASVGSQTIRAAVLGFAP